MVRTLVQIVVRTVVHIHTPFIITGRVVVHIVVRTVGRGAVVRMGHGGSTNHEIAHDFVLGLIT
ncbi:hypothetical protein ACW2QC_14005 [Virgibacillus sp. FSP13]